MSNDKQFKLVFSKTRDDKCFSPEFYEILEADDLVELLSKLPLTLAKMWREDKEYKERHGIKYSQDEEDDIPF